MSISTTTAPTWRSERWRKLTRRDLAAFDNEAMETVLAAMDRGGVGRISSKGHAILRSPKGQTMAVGPSSRKAQQVNAIRLRKLFPVVKDDATTITTTPNATAPGREGPTTEHEASMTKPKASIPCTNKSCDQKFATQGALYSHVNTEHVVCTEPGCLASFDGNRQMVPHRRIVHQGLAPRRLASAAGKVTDKAGKRLLVNVPDQREAPTEQPPSAGRGGFASMTKEQRSEAARKGAQKRWAKVRAEKAAAAEAAAQAPVEPASEPTAAPMADHTPEPVAAPTAPVADPQVVAELARITEEEEGEVAMPAPYGPTLIRQLGEMIRRLDDVCARLDSEPQPTAPPTEVADAVRRMDDWITGERVKYESWLAEVQEERDVAKAELADAHAKLALLREALDA